MEIPDHRQWMYNRKTAGNKLSHAFIFGVEEFISAASELDVFKQEGRFRCPCLKCRCLRFHEPDEVRQHLYKKGFQPDYYYWHNHGEIEPQGNVTGYEDDDLNEYEQMVMDAGGPSFNQVPEPEEPNAKSQKFYDMLCAAQSPLWDGCDNHSVLSIAVRLLSIKSDYNMTEACTNEIITLIKEVLPLGHRMPDNFYQTKRLVSELGCGYKKIDCCPSGCMLYYGDNEDQRICKFCGENRFQERESRNRQKELPKKQMWYLPIIPRLQRLFASNATAKHMAWHNEHRHQEGTLSHPSDGETWKEFNRIHSEFAVEPRNVRLGLCSDGFSPFDMNSKVYSCWPVILTPYNLPPGMCMKREYMFLTIIIPGPSNPKSKIDVYLQPLIDDLRLLWDEGVETYDISKKQNFILKAALLWTINDFPAYAMLSGWQTAGRLGCPVCMEGSKAFYLKNGRKNCYFDCHRMFLPMNHEFRKNKKNFLKGMVEKGHPPRRYSGHELREKVYGLLKITDTGGLYKSAGYGVSHNWTKRSIFWDLPYWSDLLNAHNIDVMHTESNVFQNVFNTVMDVKGKTKDNVKARMDLALLCRRPDLELEDRGNGKFIKPKAQYTLNLDQKRGICEWVQSLKLPDGYASNLGSCVDMSQCTLQHMKSHDCHIFMERLLPIAFSCLPTPIWESLTELSYFFRELCSPTLEESRLDVMEKNIPIILCKLEKIFPPAFFDAMEHLPIHLVYEARVGGPVQYRWMYPFERFLHTLKKKAKNKAHIEGSICEAYMLEETSTFCSYYFEAHVNSRIRRVPRNDDGGESFEHPPLSIFNYPGRRQGAYKSRYLNEEEVAEISLYVLLNCPEVETKLNLFVQILKSRYPGISDNEVHKQIQSNFVTWFRDYSEINKRNRAVSEGGCLNRGGSISISEHRRRYGQQLGRDPTMPELFTKLNHDQQTNQWSTDRAAQTYASYERLLEQSQAATAESSVDESLLFFQATGGKNKKGRAFGFGSEVVHYAPAGRGCGSASSSQTSAPQYDSSIQSQLQDRVIQLEAQMSENQQSVSQAMVQMSEQQTQMSQQQAQMSQHQAQMSVQQQTTSQLMTQMMSELIAIRQQLSTMSQGPSVPPHSSQTPSVPVPTIDEDEEQEADDADDAALGDD